MELKMFVNIIIKKHNFNVINIIIEKKINNKI